MPCQPLPQQSIVSRLYFIAGRHIQSVWMQWLLPGGISSVLLGIMASRFTDLLPRQKPNG
ncbi:hypothetical protein KCP71_22060 [Salmonella enterica subsp. enterica]|nr:hypothetical protein KCP71_22060 [Salmonella enterica subsp. enterica]